MPKKNNKKIIKKASRKKTNLSRYNIFQKELSEYIKETGGQKSDYKKYRSLYNQIGKDVPVKAFPAIIGGLITTKAKDIKTLKYTESFPFYNARSEFLTSRFIGVKIKIKFSDGGFSLDWEGDAYEFQSWFSGDVISYFRNNYNDSGNMANFVLSGGDDTTAEYEIQVGGSAYGTPGYIEADKNLLNAPTSIKKSSVVQKDAETERLRIKERVLDKELALIQQYKELGFSNEEIKKRLSNM
jgi:hypothetical protein